MLVLAVLGAAVIWQFLPPADLQQAASERSESDRSGAGLAPGAVRYNVEGIEGIVDIDEVTAPGVAMKEESGSRQLDLPELAREARAGDAKAMTGLALALRTGSDASADPLAAIDWLKRASAAGDANAMAALAAEYESGAWLPADPRKARSLREAAARAGSRLAQWELEP